MTPRLDRLRVGTVVSAWSFALYLLAGRWGATRLLGEGVDDYAILLEVRFWAVVVLSTTFVWRPRVATDHRRRRWLTVMVGLLLALFFYLATSALWSPDPRLAAMKAYEVGLTALATLGWARALRVGNTVKTIDAFWTAVFALSGLLALVAFAGFAAGGGGQRLAVLGGGPNIFARLMGLLALSALRSWRRGGRAWVFVPVASLALLLVLLSGSRGSLVALVVALLFFFLLEFRSATRIIASVVVAGAFTWAALTFTEIGRAALERYDQRVRGLLLQEQYTAGRGDLYQSAIDLGVSAPVFGAGLAAFPGLGLGVYPHNLFLELFCETGLVGVVLYSSVMAAVAFVFLRARQLPDGMAFAAFLLVFVASQFSGDLYDSRGVLGLLIVVLATPSVSDASRA